ncbi:MAG TPA: hypothetical protein VK034_31800 [Enhygromyxa sp.]|nr:hypothetical protein [Enhygromyxa sp.]
MGIGHDLLNVPMGDMIRQMAFAIADAQWELDESSIRVAEMMSGKRVLRDADGNLVDAQGSPSTTPVYEDTRVYFGRRKVTSGSPPVDEYEPEQLSMLELGFTPNFYQFIDTLIEVKVAIKMSYETSSSRTIKGVERTARFSRNANGGFSFSVTTTPVDATYSSKYSYSAEGSSLLRTKLVPVPPPPVLEERIRRLLDQDLEERED